LSYLIYSTSQPGGAVRNQQSINSSHRPSIIRLNDLGKVREKREEKKSVKENHRTSIMIKTLSLYLDC